MSPEEIKEEFFKAISERGIYKKLNVKIEAVSHWKNPDRVPTLGKMIEVLLQLEVIRIEKND
ncbi:hypothetical protein ACX0HA_09025 [Flavobacterium hauense]